MNAHEGAACVHVATEVGYVMVRLAQHGCQSRVDVTKVPYQQCAYVRVPKRGSLLEAM